MKENYEVAAGVKQQLEADAVAKSLELHRQTGAAVAPAGDPK